MTYLLRINKYRFLKSWNKLQNQYIINNYTALRGVCHICGTYHPQTKIYHLYVGILGNSTINNFVRLPKKKISVFIIYCRSFRLLFFFFFVTSISGAHNIR